MIKYKYKYNDKYQFLEVKLYGVLKVNDIIDHYNNISKNDSLPDNLKIIIDYRDAKFDIDVESMALTYCCVKNALKRYDTIRDAIIIDSPFETAVAVMFERINSNFKTYSCGVFSTEDASLHWLNVKNYAIITP